MHKITHRLKAQGRKIGFVPTMGYLHQGHLSLMRRSVHDCDVTIVSIYVNPLQFGPREDFKKYPRDLKQDRKKAAKIGVDYLFVPSDQQMYPRGYATTIEVGRITETLCGASRPGHFRGVTTVVNKLFNIVSPDIAYFGQKDAQQAQVIKKMVSDLNIHLKIKELPIVRAADGLALSSRNSYLTQQQRQDALVIYQALKLAKRMISGGERRVRKIISAMKTLISTRDSVRIDYVAIVDAEDLTDKKIIAGKVLIAIAVFLNRIRLIDNIIVNVKK